MTEREWLDGLKAGDEVAVTQHLRDPRITVVERVTRTQVMVPLGLKFRRDDGRVIGGSTWERPRIEEPTPAIRGEIRRRALRDSIPRRDWNALSLAKLERIAAILDEPEPTAGEGGPTCV